MMATITALGIKMRLHIVLEFFDSGKPIRPRRLAFSTDNPIKNRRQHQVGCPNGLAGEVSTQKAHVDKRTRTRPASDRCNEHDLQIIRVGIVVGKHPFHLCLGIRALNAINFAFDLIAKFGIVTKKRQSPTRSNLPCTLGNRIRGKAIKRIGKPRPDMGVHPFVVAVCLEFLRPNTAIHHFTSRKINAPVQQICFLSHNIDIADIRIKPEKLHHGQARHPVLFVKHPPETPQHFLTRTPQSNQHSWPNADLILSAMRVANAFCSRSCFHHGLPPSMSCLSFYAAEYV